MSVHVIARESPFTYHWFLSSFLLCPLPQRTVMGSGGWPEDLQVISDFFCLLASCWLSNFFWVKKRKLSCRRVETSTTEKCGKNRSEGKLTTNKEGEAPYTKEMFEKMFFKHILDFEGNQIATYSTFPNKYWTSWPGKNQCLLLNRFNLVCCI